MAIVSCRGVLRQLGSVPAQAGAATAVAEQALQAVEDCLVSNLLELERFGSAGEHAAYINLLCDTCIVCLMLYLHTYLPMQPSSAPTQLFHALYGWKTPSPLISVAGTHCKCWWACLCCIGSTDKMFMPYMTEEWNAWNASGHVRFRFQALTYAGYCTGSGSHVYMGPAEVWRLLAKGILTASIKGGGASIFQSRWCSNAYPI